MLDVVEYIIKNKNKIAQDAVLWMTENHPSRTSSPEKCSRDIKYLLDAYISDLNSNNSMQVINIANNFWSRVKKPETEIQFLRQVELYKTEVKVHKHVVKKIKENISIESGKKLQSLVDIFCSILINGPIEEINSVTATLEKYRYVREYDTETKIDQSLVEKCIQTAWKNTPSKNNFMNYRVTVVGPDRQDLKDIAFNLCLQNECKADSNKTLEEFWQERYSQPGSYPQFHNIKSCSYMLIFSQRPITADDLNPWQKYSIERGRSYEQWNQPFWRSRLTSLIEASLFASNLGALCLENGLDISHTLCMPSNPLLWLEFEKIGEDPQVFFIMTIGKGKVYRRDRMKEIEQEDRKPNFYKVVNFL